MSGTRGNPQDRETPRDDQDRILDLYNNGRYSAEDRDTRLGDIREHLNGLPGQ